MTKMAMDIALMNGIATALSILGELFMIVSYFSIPSLRTFSMKLIVSLAVADFFYSISNIFSFFNDNQLVCITEGFVRQTATISTIVWVVLITHTSYTQISNLINNISKLKGETYPYLFIMSIIVSVIGTVPYEKFDYFNMIG